LDNQLKENANGKIMVGIYYNFAKVHNAAVSQLKTRKNLVAKYKNINIFAEGRKLIPQFITEEDFIMI
jgi:hypothetical protein